MSNLEPEAGEGEFCEAVLVGIHRLVLLLRSQGDGPASSDSLTPQQLGILAYLEQGPRSITWMSQTKGITRAAAAVQIDRLAARGLVQKMPDPSDGRVVLACLTREGKRVRTENHRRSLQRLSQMARHLTEEERKHLILGIQAVTRVLSAAGLPSDVKGARRSRNRNMAESMQPRRANTHRY